MCSTITYKQFKRLFFIAFLALNFLTYPAKLSSKVNSDGIIPLILVCIVSYLGQCAFFKLMSYYRGKTFYEILCIIFPKKIAVIINVIFMLNFILLISYSLRLISEQVCFYILPEMPLIYVESIFLLSILFLVLKRIRTMGNLAQISVGVIVLNFFILILLCLRACNFENMLPMFTSKLPDYISSSYDMSSYMFSATLGLVYIIPYVSDYYENEKRVYKDFAYICFGVFLIYSIFYVLCYSVLGHDFCMFYVFPAMSIVQSDNAKNIFVERYELILLGNVFLMIYLYQAVQLRSLKEAANAMLSGVKNKKIGFICAMVAVVLLTLIFNEQTVGVVIYRFVDSVNLSANHMLIPFFIYAAHLLRRGKVDYE